MEVTITFPDTIKLGGKGFELDYATDKLAAAIIGQLAQHGLRQKAVDGASAVPGQLTKDHWVAVKVKGGMDAAKADEAWGKLPTSERKALVANFSGLEANWPAINAAKGAARDKVLRALEEGKWEVRTAAESHGVDPDVLREFVAIREANGNPFKFEKGTPTAKREATWAEAFLALAPEKQGAIKMKVAKDRAERAELAKLMA